MSMVDVSYEVGVANGGAYIAAAAFGFMLRRWYDAFPTAIALALAAPLTAFGIRLLSGEEVGAWASLAYPIHALDFWLERGIVLGILWGEMVAAYGLATSIAYVGVGRTTAYVAVIGVTVAAAVFFLERGYSPTERADIAKLIQAELRRIDNDRTSRCFTDPATRLDIPAPPQPPSFEDVEVLRTLPPEYADVPLLETSPWGQRGDDRLLTPIDSIRSVNSARYKGDDSAVALNVIVGTEGQVLAALPVAGPTAEYGAAVSIAKRWRFVPYVFEGRPIVVKLDRMHVPITGPDRTPARHIPFPTVTDRHGVRIHLVQRSGDFSNDSYLVTIRGDGKVRYEGLSNVALEGEHCAAIAPEAVERLITAFRNADFYALDDQYVMREPDALLEVATAVSISVDGRTKAVVDLNGMLTRMPASVTQLQNLIDDGVDVRRWTHGNERTGPSLQAERWNFSRLDSFNRSMLVGAAQHGSASAVADLVRLGAPAGDRNWDPLHYATQRRDFDMIRALLASNVAWTQEQLNDALVETADMGSNEFVTLLLRRNADPNATYINQRALMAAATSGVPEVVATLLAAGASIKATDNLYGGTALHSAAPFGIAPSTPEARFEATQADRGKVVRLLVEAGIPVDVRDDWQRTPLNHNSRGYVDVTAALIELGADVNTQDIEGTTPLMSTNNAKAVEMLLAAGANAFLTDAKGRTALDGDQREFGETSKAIRTVLNRWIAIHPDEAQRMREEAKRIGKSRIPKRIEPEAPNITPVDHVSFDGRAALLLVIATIAQMLIVFALTRIVLVRFGRE